MRWNAESVWTTSHTGEWFEIAGGPIAEVAEVPYGGLVLQRSERDSVIWLVTETGPQELIVAGDDQSLTLEGAGLNSDDEPIVFYQRHEIGQPANSRASLRTYNLDTGEVVELVETGEWEAGTQFDHLSLESTAVAHWWAEAGSGNTIIDLDRPSPPIWDLAGVACADGDRSCAVYEHATVVDGRTIGIRPVWNADGGGVDEIGLYEFDLGGGTERLIASFAWDNALWYVEDMFAAPGNRVVLSLSDSPDAGGNPLPALVVALDSGEAFTLPEAFFVRPAHLS